MKLSDIKGERTIEVIAEIIEPIANIAADANTSKLFKKVTAKNEKEAKKLAREKLVKFLPVLLKDHKQDVISILAAVAGKTYEEYSAEMNLASLTKDATDLITDAEFLTLFQSAV